MANTNEAAVHFKAALAELRQSSAAGFPESFIARAINKLEAGMAKLEGKPDVAIKPDVEANRFPPTNNRGNEPKAVVPAKAAVVSVGKYADGWSIEGDRSTFPATSPGGAKRLSVEPKK